jgi:hypothetical protein
VSDYSNLRALSQGCVSGRISEWPMLKIEAGRVLASIAELEAENARLKEERSEDTKDMDWLETQDCWIGLKLNFCEDGCEPVIAAGKSYRETVRSVCRSARKETNG